MHRSLLFAVLFAALVLPVLRGQAQTLTVLYSFSGNPFAGLVMDRDGNLFGTTTFGGSLFVANVFNGYGTVFQVDTFRKDRNDTELLRPRARESVVHSFSPLEGGSPQAGLIRDKDGIFYGTTAFFGAFDSGTVFKLDCRHHQTEEDGEAAKHGIGIGCPSHFH
jgi:uncharacterized repeat protein (TIGR03803 family)